MREVMISVQPKWCELIANGKKTVEVRKTKPKLETPFKCYIYCTKNTEKRIGHWLNLYCDGKQVTTDIKLEEPCYPLNGKVIGEFVCDDIQPYDEAALFIGLDEISCSEIEIKSCVDLDELLSYKGDKKYIYGWHISDLVIYDKPKELSEFRTHCKDYYDANHCEDCEYFIDGRGYEYDESDCGCDGLKPIKRPPQSWCYVKEGAE